MDQLRAEYSKLVLMVQSHLCCRLHQPGSAGVDGIEPPTHGFGSHCSTAELYPSRGGEIRTPSLWHPKPVAYQIGLHPVVMGYLSYPNQLGCWGCHGR